MNGLYRNASATHRWLAFLSKQQSPQLSPRACVFLGRMNYLVQDLLQLVPLTTPMEPLSLLHSVFWEQLEPLTAPIAPLLHSVFWEQQLVPLTAPIAPLSLLQQASPLLTVPLVAPMLALFEVDLQLARARAATAARPIMPNLRIGTLLEGIVGTGQCGTPRCQSGPHTWYAGIGKRFAEL